ncbi:hypothetical protein AAG570_003845 [Ranatra chinensis]|uniref:CRAL-TRIO domain-containing protein n=1 Tax=Ranatra chinensis TaxID=642074 RepID=A0ABD0YK72_9HEMI
MVKNNLQKAKVSIELYIEAREKCPRIFQGRDVSNQDLKECFKVVTLSTLPGVTPLGYCASIVRFEDVDWNKFNVEALLKRLMMVMEYFLKEGLDFSGFHVVLDLANLKFGHLKKFNIEIMKTIKILMKAYPVSFSRISLINYPQFIQKGIAIFKPFLSEKLMQRVRTLILSVTM